RGWSWGVEIVGELRKVLFASPALVAKLPRPPVPVSALREFPFVCPVYRQQGRVVPVDDDCPLPRAQRRVGHQVQTIVVALEVAAATSQLVFGPTIAAQRHVRSGALIEVPVQGWDVKESLQFACHVDRVSARQRAAIAGALRTSMKTASAKPPTDKAAAT